MVATSEVAPVPGVSAPADLIGADEERRAKLQALALELPKSSVTKEAAQMFAAVDPRFHPASNIAIEPWPRAPAGHASEALPFPEPDT
jgi:hypothetical protein